MNATTQREYDMLINEAQTCRQWAQEKTAAARAYYADHIEGRMYSQHHMDMWISMSRSADRLNELAIHLIDEAAKLRRQHEPGTPATEYDMLDNDIEPEIACETTQMPPIDTDSEGEDGEEQPARTTIICNAGVIADAIEQLCNDLHAQFHTGAHTAITITPAPPAGVMIEMETIGNENDDDTDTEPRFDLTEKAKSMLAGGKPGGTIDSATLSRMLDAAMAVGIYNMSNRIIEEWGTEVTYDVNEVRDQLLKQLDTTLLDTLIPGLKTKATERGLL